MKNLRSRTLITSFVAALSIFSGLLPAKGASFFDLIPGGNATPGYYGVTFEERQPGLGELISVISS